MREGVWTEDGISLLRKMWAEGATAATIGARLGGFSRSAVLGKVFRLRLNGEGDTADRIERAARQPPQAARAAAAQNHGCASGKGPGAVHIIRPE
jgi:GcrA cell cycle regulator